MALIDASERGDHAQRQRFRRHFHAEDGARLVRAERGVLGDVDGQRGLAHGRPARNDDQVAGLQTRGHFIEFLESGCDAGHLAVGVIQLVDAIDHVRQNALDRSESDFAARTALGDFEHRALGFIDDFARFAPFRLERRADDEIARGDELAQHRALAHDVRIGANVGGGGRIARQRSQVGQAANLIQKPVALQMSGQGDGIAGLSCVRSEPRPLRRSADDRCGRSLRR